MVHICRCISQGHPPQPAALKWMMMSAVAKGLTVENSTGSSGEERYMLSINFNGVSSGY